MYAELVSIDRLSYNQVAKSSFIQEAMRNKKLVSHSSHVTIRKKVAEFYAEAKTETKEFIKKAKESGKKFSITFDEWSGRNRRYMTVNLHLDEGKWINLGMIRVWHSQKSESLLKLVEGRLKDYGVNLSDDVIAMVTDGCSVMLKLGRIAPCEHIVCLSHTLHLVVGDIFYKKKKKTKSAAASSSSNDENEEDSESDSEELPPTDDPGNSNDETEEELDVDEEDGALPDLSQQSTEDAPVLIDTLEPIVKKVRKLSSTFR
jgi:hypothetical protein